MKSNPLKQLGTLGQSIWLDYIRRDLIAKGELRRLIEEDGLRGMTSNPSIFEKAIADSHDYDDDIRAMALAGKGVAAIYETLSQHDVQSAADVFKPLYDKTEGKDGFVSLEVNPHLAHDTEGTLKEARRLWVALNRPNVLIKVPATTEGLPVIQQLISEGMYTQSKPYPQMLALARELKARYGLNIVVVSNEGRELNAYRIRKFKLDGFVDAFVSSCYVHLRKPDLEIFRLALDISQVPLRQIVYVENTPMFVQIAEGLGIRSILHTDYESTCAQLAAFGLQSPGTDSERGGNEVDKGRPSC